MINEWWANEPDQRFWMETIRRTDFGDTLEAPYTKADGTTSGYYELVGKVHVGDVVLHWVTAREGKPSVFDGWSVVAGLPFEVDTTFNGGSPTKGQRVLLERYTRFSKPLTHDELTARVNEIREVRSTIRAKSDGTAYFPFGLYRSGDIRAVEGGYLTKFPIELFEVLPELSAAQAGAGPAIVSPPATEPRDNRRQAREAGYMADAQVRRAIEMQAVAQATAHYESLGYEVEDVGASRSYDLHLTRLGTDDERHVEVKGSTGAAEEVELTIGEVEHARNFQPTDLFIVGGIEWRRTEEGVTTQGGNARLVADWTPAPDSLRAVRFRHTVPAATKLEGIGTDV